MRRGGYNNFGSLCNVRKWRSVKFGVGMLESLCVNRSSMIDMLLFRKRGGGLRIIGLD